MASAEIAAEHERILREIESTDTNCIGPTLRSVYDGQEHGLFMEKLEGRIRNHDREIEKMCNHHFQGFVDSITELLKVRGEAQKLKGQVTETNQKLQNDGKELLTSMNELRQCRVQQRNIATTIDKLTHCLPVLEMYSKLQEQMRAKRYYPALRTLEQLEESCLPQAGSYRFCTIMAENIPRLRTHIRDVSMSDLKDFLESIRKHSDKIGETAMKQAQVQIARDNAVTSQQRSASGRRIRKEGYGSTEVDRTGNNPFSEQDSGILDVDDEQEEEVPGAHDLVDFSPVYRCLHIYTVLGARDTFENYYRKQRRKQARLVLQPHSNMHETLEGYRRYFNQIVGFFVVEDHILHTTQGLVNRAYVEELWELALSKTIAALRTHSSYCTDPDLVLDLKNLIVLFADTLQGYGFPVNQLFDMLLEMRDQYGEILLKKWSQSFRQILDQDNYSPIPVVSPEEYQRITGQFPFQDPELDKMPFPKKLPFSEFVPKVYSQLKEFIYACLKYSEDLHLSSTEIDDMIRKSTNLLLTRTLSHCLQYAIKKKNVGLAELVQIIINTTHLEQSCHYLEEFISNITNVPPDTINATKLYGTSTFKDARHAAEEEIYTNLNQKIDQFLQLADYDWTAAQGGGQASDYLSDLIAFLCSTFAVFTHLPGNAIEHATLPGKVAQTACMSACKHLSTSLLQLLLEADVRQVSMGALQQFNVDVKECERFARAGPVPGFQGDTLLLAFIDLRQLLDLFTQWDWSTYLADYGRPTCKYLRVNPHTALALLEKMKDTSRKNNMFAQFRKNERDKQKLIDTVVKQLRNLIASNQA
ncbi:exocyst complex component 6B isoform X1 [Danio rerio]|uniref:Exocyst complex component 6B isoform X1 n=1 Tax=Danio rerio TaxID=7955 RepID=A0AC58G0F1_DANRE|nr:exocyst complex component 6B isoform X2 [Danio rerio]|eukprot:XP_021333285.1 exocyst complex component 6B isoform X2 [Danio rerio]